MCQAGSSYIATLLCCNAHTSVFILVYWNTILRNCTRKQVVCSPTSTAHHNTAAQNTSKIECATQAQVIFRCLVVMHTPRWVCSHYSAKLCTSRRGNVYYTSHHSPYSSPEKRLKGECATQAQVILHCLVVMLCSCSTTKLYICQALYILQVQCTTLQGWGFWVHGQNGLSSRRAHKRINWTAFWWSGRGGGEWWCWWWWLTLCSFW